MGKNEFLKPLVFALLFIAIQSFVLLLPQPSLANPQSDPTLLFADKSNAAGVNFTHKTPITSGDGALMISGGISGDFNNDGWQDLFIIGGGDGMPDKLFINQQDGTFVDLAASAGLAELHMGVGASAGDYNNDGWLDIYVTSMGPIGNMAVGQHRLYRNNGDLTFTNTALEAGVNQTSPVYPDGTGSTFGDYDLDGDLDLFVAGWRYPEDPPDSGTRIPALGNRLFQNNGDGTFTDVTAVAVPEVLGDGTSGNDVLRGFSPCFADMNGDRFPELLIVADFGTSLYFQNNKDGTFIEYTNASGTGLEWSGMGSAIGDINQDGLIDWYATAIYDIDHVEPSGRGDGNKLYINNGNHSFTEIAESAGVADGGWGWGTVIVDLDHDGQQDIIETNGWEFNDPGSPLEEFKDENVKVWLRNTPGIVFSEEAIQLGLTHNLHGIGMLNLDYDNDGDQDVAITAYNDQFRLYENQVSGENKNWLRIYLDTVSNPQFAPNGIGSRIQVKIGATTYHHYMNSCSHYLSQSEISAHFGLYDATMIDEIIVSWPDGSSTTLTDVSANQTLTIVAGPMNPVYLPIIQMP